jgi:hypothetical protein
MAKNKINLIPILCFLFILSVAEGFPVFCKAAVLYLESEKKEYAVGDTLILDIRIDNAGQCINTVGVNLSFPNNILLVDDFVVEDSILTHWVEKPRGADITDINKNGRISFSGGIPGGYCGRISGDPGLTNILAKIIFRIPSLIIMGGDSGKEVEINFLPESKVFLHDGLGTEAELYIQGIKFSISDRVQPSENEWEKKLEEDDLLPEPFIVELQKSPSIFNGKYFIIFWTTDKQTGLDHFKVKEGEKQFKIVNSPYLLEDQTLTSKILVKAVDKAGNERIVEYIPSEHGYSPEKRPEIIPLSWQGIILILVALIIIIVIIRLFIKKISPPAGGKKQKEIENEFEI